MTSRLNVQAIFDSIDGEENGFQGAGELTTFIRLKGCPLRCRWCDTKYAQESKPENWMTVEEICEQVHFEKITLTGGDPLLQKDNLIPLIRCLLDRGLKITIETNGSIDIPEEFFGTFLNKLRLVVDFKLPSSDMMKHMKTSVFESLRPEDVIKFVISDEYDYKYALTVIDQNPSWIARKVFSPAVIIEKARSRKINAEERIGTSAHVNMSWPRQLVEMMIRDRVDAQFSLQIHKVLWPGAEEER